MDDIHHGDAEDEVERMERHVRKRWLDRGLREGLLTGKMEAMQPAFDIGFERAALEEFLGAAGGCLPKGIWKRHQDRILSLPSSLSPEMMLD
jgi:hypothetical protein